MHVTFLHSDFRIQWICKVCASLNGMNEDKVLELEKKAPAIYPLQMSLGTFFHCNSHNIFRAFVFRWKCFTLEVRDFWCGFQWTAPFYPHLERISIQSMNFIHAFIANKKRKNVPTNRRWRKMMENSWIEGNGFIKSLAKQFKSIWICLFIHCVCKCTSYTYTHFEFNSIK